MVSALCDRHIISLKLVGDLTLHYEVGNMMQSSQLTLMTMTIIIIIIILVG
jgi:predicted RND superfamily exporter protein